jgi:hypothetical protein
MIEAEVKLFLGFVQDRARCPVNRQAGSPPYAGQASRRPVNRASCPVFGLKSRCRYADMSVRRRAFMFRRIHQWLSAAVGVFGFATAWAASGYLPQAGPLPLRFRVPLPHITEHAEVPVAPPLPAPIALPAPPMPPAPPEVFNAAPAKAVKPVAITNGPPLEYNARESFSEPLPGASADAVISPQMLIKYFTPPANASTNAPGAGVAAPMGFTPPPVPAPPATPPSSSKATYSTSP